MIMHMAKELPVPEPIKNINGELKSLGMAPWLVQVSFYINIYFLG